MCIKVLTKMEIQCVGVREKAEVNKNELINGTKKEAPVFAFVRHSGRPTYRLLSDVTATYGGISLHQAFLRFAHKSVVFYTLTVLCA